MNADNERLAAHLENHLDSLFTFLEVARLDATNWRGEQAIRPAVVNRKVWGGNRTIRGAVVQGILMSVLRTLAQRDIDALTWLAAALPRRYRSPARDGKQVPVSWRGWHQS